MKTLMISADPKVCDKNSAVRVRMRALANEVGSLTIMVGIPKGSSGEKITDGFLTILPVVSTRIGRMYTLLARGKRLILGNTFDLITCQDPFDIGLVGWKLSRRAHIPLEIQIHTDIWSPFFGPARKFNKALQVVASFVLRHADRIRVVAPRITDSLVLRGIDIEKIIVLPVWVPSYKVSSSFVNTGHTVVTASRLTFEKDIPTLIDAFVILSSTIPDAKLIIAGDGPERARLEQYARESGLADKISFVGWQKDMSILYAQASVFALSSLYEGFGLVLLEASSAGVPIVTTDVGLVGSFLRHKEHLLAILPKDPQAFARALKEVFGNPEVALGRAQKAQIATKELSIPPSEYAKKQAEIWREIVTNKS